MKDIPKLKLNLLNNIPNVFTQSQSTIDAFKVDEYDHENIIRTIKLLLHRINHFSTSLMVRKIEDNFDDVDFVRLIKYPLPAAFNIKTKRVLINLQVLGKKEITNIDPRTLYSVIFYGYLCKLYTLKPLKINTQIEVSDYFTDLLMKLFGKKYGIMASYQEMIPKLRFICITYILTSFYGIPQKVSYKKAVRSRVTQKDFNIDFDDYDLSNARDFIKILSESGVFPGIDLSFFIGYVLKNRNLGLSSIPMFEDEMRFMATLGASTLPSGGLFPPYLEAFNASLHRKIVMMIHPYM
jgi:hypothetical protein